MNKDWQVMIENKVELKNIMRQLPPADRALIILLCNGVSRFEIAMLVNQLGNRNITVDAIHQHVHRMRERIKQLLQKEQE